MLHIRNNFLDFLQHQKRYSQQTLTAYQGDLEQFFQYLVQIYGDDLDLPDLKALHVRSWMVQLTQEGVTAKTVG